jgi:hypothetical protein
MSCEARNPISGARTAESAPFFPKEPSASRKPGETLPGAWASVIGKRDSVPECASPPAFAARKSAATARRRLALSTDPRRAQRQRTAALRGAAAPLRPASVSRSRFMAVACAGLTLLAIAASGGNESSPEGKPAERQPSAKATTPARQPDFPLMAAARAGESARVKELLAQGAAEDQRNARLETSLFVAASLGHQDVVQALVDVPAGIDIPDHEGRTPLFAAAAAGHLKVVELLLDNGAQPNSSKNTGESPLFVAVENKHLEVVKALLKMGALSTSYDFRGRTPLLVAREQGNQEMIEILEKAHARLPDERVPESVRAVQTNSAARPAK